MKYYVCADGGGTKLLALLFDESFKLLSTAKGGAMNQLFSDPAEVEASIYAAASALLEGQSVDEIETVFISMAGPAHIFIAALRKLCRVVGEKHFSEGYACLCAGLLKTRGVLALSGTGADVFRQDGERILRTIGGWGALFGDEGSGYYIGAAAIRAAQFAFDGRGEKTALTDTIIEDYKLKDLHEIVGLTYSTRDYRRVICKACLSCLRAAAMGDEAAISIMRDAGHQLALMTTTLFRTDDIPTDTDICVSGSVWRNNLYMYEAFKAEVNAALPDAQISKPIFEPVVGGAAHLALQSMSRDDAKTLLLQSFKDYIYEK